MATLRTRRILPTLLGLLAAAAPFAAAQDDEGIFAPFARELGLAKDPTAPHETTLATLRGNPDAYRNVRVILTLQMNERTNFWNPFFTRFTPDNYVNFSAWGDEQRLWVAAEYGNEFPLFFVDRRSEPARKILAAEPFQRFRVTAIVRDTFRGMPWIEVTKVKSLSEKLARGTLVHGARGRKWMEAGKWALAANEFDRAIAGDLPDASRVGLLKDLSVCHYARGDRDKTRSVLLAAADLDPKDAEVNAALEALLLEDEEAGASAQSMREIMEPEPAPPRPAPPAESTDHDHVETPEKGADGGTTSDTPQGNTTDHPQGTNREPDGK